jgi:hypothetical protein
MYQWDNDTKLMKLMSCLRDKAIEFIANRPTAVRRDFKLLLKELRRHYGKHESASSYRKQLFSTKQADSESIDDYAETVRRLTARGFPGVEEKTRESLATDAFLQGCKDKSAALTVMNKKPKSLDKALRAMHKIQQNAKSIGKNITFHTRAVTFNDQHQQPTPSPSKQYSEEIVATLTEALKRAFGSVKPAMNQGNGSPRIQHACFRCGEHGHIARNCPQKTPPSSPERVMTSSNSIGKVRTNGDKDSK